MKAMCGTRNTFAKQEVKWFAGLQEVRGRDVLWVTSDEFRKAFPSEPRGFNYDFNQLTPIQSGRTYAIASVGGNARPITRRVVFTETNKPTKCGAMCRNAKGFLCDCSCKGVNHGAGATFSREGSNDIDLTPTEEMAANAKRGLELRRKHGRGGTAVGVARARDISNRKTLSPETVRRMHAFFSRHEKNKAGGEDDAGYIAWMLWSGDAGQGWAKRKVEQMDKSENQRSETYKAIAERLGSAAKMSVEAGWRVSPDAKSSGLTVAELLPKLTKGHTFYANLKSGGTVSGTLKAFSTSGVKIDKYGEVTDLRWSDIASIGAGNIGTGPYPIRAARPGAKAVFATEVGRKGNKAAMITRDGTGTWYAYVVQRGETGIGPFEEMLGTMRSYATEEKAKRAAIKALDTSGFSRPGAKASFAQDARAVAQEILRQLGGGRFMAMVGGKNAMHGTFGGKPGLQVSIGKGAEGGINRLIVTLDPATDTYNMEFWRIGNRGLSTKKVSEASMVYADDLQRVFTDRTKFYTSMSRPGAKAKMAKWTVTPTQKHGKDIEEHTAKIGRDHWKIDSMPHLGKSVGSLYRWDEMRGLRHISTGNIEQLKRQAEAISTKQDALSDVMRGFSRPGAKAEMAKFKVGDRVAYKPHPANTAGELVEIRKPTSLEGVEMQYGIKQASGSIMWVPEGMLVRASRPGVKAKNALYMIEIVEGGRVTSTITPDQFRDFAVKNVPGVSRNDFVTTMMEKWNDYAEEHGFGARVRIGGKSKNAVREGSKISAEDEACLKVMSAADEKVSDKIRTLIAEGKPQKQAVAIALDLKRRGEL